MGIAIRKQDGEKAVKERIDDYSQWWKVFYDPVLDRLVQTAYEQNLSLQIAGLRVLAARAQLGIAAGNLYPQNQEMTGDYSYNRGSNPAPGVDRYFSAASIGFDAAWELDFWGKFRRGIQSANANLLADIASYDDVLVTLTILGYGDILPQTQGATALCQAEAIIGQFFIAVLVARLVGIEASQQTGNGDDDGCRV